MNNWTPQEDQTLARMVRDGVSAAGIAKTVQRSRSAVLGRIMRLKLRPAATQAAKAMHLHPGNIARKKESRALDPVYFEPACVVALPSAPKMLALVDLHERACRFPIGDPQSSEFGFCGHDAPIGVPYCAAHARLCYTPVMLRKVAA